MTGLDELELDALTEIFNVGVGLAADALHQMLGEHIPLSVPQVELTSQIQAQKQFLAREQSELCVVQQTYTGDFTTEALLVFADSDSLKLVRMMVGADLPAEELAALRQDALGEMGNIVLNAVISNLSTSLSLPLEGSIPQVSNTTAAQLFDHGTDAMPGQEAQVLALMIDFALSSQNVQAHLIFLLNSTSTAQLRQHLARSM